MNKRIWVNRAIVIIAILVAVAGLFAAQYFTGFDIKAPSLFSGPEKDPIAFIEENGYVDVLYYGIGEDKSTLFWQTPTAALGIIWYTPGFDDVDARYHVRLTNTGWEIIRGAYNWTPDTEEEYQDKLHLWNFSKFHWWKERAMFKADGSYNRAYEAMYGLLDWYQTKMICDFLYRTFIWAENSGQEWNVLEIDIVALNGPIILPGYIQEAKGGYVVGFWPQLSGTLVMFKTRKEAVPTPDGRMTEITRRPAQEAIEQGELTEESFDTMQKTLQIQVVPTMTFYGPREYTKGFNHPWQARELTP